MNNPTPRFRPNLNGSDRDEMRTQLQDLYQQAKVLDRQLAQVWAETCHARNYQTLMAAGTAQVTDRNFIARARVQCREVMDWASAGARLTSPEE